MDGKLARLRKQDEQLLAATKNVTDTFKKKKLNK